MSFCCPSESNPSAVLSFMGAVTTPRVDGFPASNYSGNRDSPIDLMSSDEEEGFDSMPELVNPRPRLDDSSSSDEVTDSTRRHRRNDSSSEEEGEIRDESSNKAMVSGVSSRRNTPPRKGSLLGKPSYFESEDEDEVSYDNRNDDDEEYLEGSGSTYPPEFGTNRLSTFSKHKGGRSKKQIRSTTAPVTIVKDVVASKMYSGPASSGNSMESNNDSNPNSSWSNQAEHHRAGSVIWSSPNLCPKGICLVVQTKTEVHVVQDCPAGQVYVFRQLTSIVHLQQVDCKLASYLKAGFSSGFPVLLYRMNRDYISPFCVVLNSTKLVAPILDLIQFGKMNRLLVEVDPNNVYGSLRQAKRSSISYGFATGRCVHRDDNGTAVPSLLKHTSDPFVKNLFVALSSVLGIDLLPAWAKYKPDAERLPFAASIAQDNVLEGLTIHLTNRNNLLQPHVDSHNPPLSENSQLSIVVGASQWVGGNRIGATGYLRKSISECMVRTNNNAPLLEEISSVYGRLPTHRQHMNPETFETAHRLGCHLDTNHFTIPCNIDPMGKVHVTCKWMIAFKEVYKPLSSILYLTMPSFSVSHILKKKQASMHCSFTQPACCSMCFT